jgi:DNA (cytosine-5)-methyltransferase 1
MLENVKMLVSNNFIQTFMKWVEFLNSLGYVSSWKVLNGRDYGIPQDRSRVFVVSILNPESDFVFPVGTGVTTSVEDYMLTKDELGEELYNKLCVKKELVERYIADNKQFLKFAVKQN